MSHVGRALAGVHQGGFAWALEVLARKAQLNEILMHRSSLTGLFFAAIPVLLALGLRPPRVLEPLLPPAVRPLLVAGPLSGLAAFFLNDSGIVAGGLLLAFVLTGAGYLALREV
jgi:hypothetical protein